MEIHKSRWGYHSCSYEDFVKLRKAHLLFYKAYTDAKKYIRWFNKEPQNRGTTNPPVPEEIVSIIDEGYYALGINRDRVRTMRYGKHMISGKTDRRPLYLIVLEQYRNAKRPKESPENVSPLSLPKNYEDALAKIQDIYKVAETQKI